MSLAWTADSILDQSGRTIVITGATSGLGLASAEALAGRGARVLLAARNPEKAEAARSRVAALATEAEPEVVALDLSDLDSVRAAANDIAGRTERVDVLMNNAGVMATPLERTAQGFEMQIGTNHLGHFALTGLLLPSLLAAEAPRVVTTSSNVHKAGKIRWDDLNWETGYKRWAAYAQSKLANLLFTYELARRAHGAGQWLVSAAAHPGYASTHLQTAAPEASGRRGMVRFMELGNRLWAQSAADGALPQLYAATMDDVGSADYFGPDGRLEMTGSPVRTTSIERSRDRADGRRLWEMSEELTGVSYAWPASDEGADPISG